MRIIWKERLGFLSLFLTILSLAITITINFAPLYQWDIQHLSILNQVELTKTQLVQNYSELMNYLNSPWLSSLQLSDFPVSESGALHFYEVKRLFLLNYGVLLVTILPTLFFLYYLWKEKKLWKLIRPFQWAACIPLFLGFFMMMGFDQFFYQFHSMFFNNDAWLFNPVTDPIILALPEEFFMHCFVLFFIVIEFLFIVGYFVGKKQLKKL